jgi:hypothetical protein
MQAYKGLRFILCTLLSSAQFLLFAQSPFSQRPQQRQQRVSRAVEVDDNGVPVRPAVRAIPLEETDAERRLRIKKGEDDLAAYEEAMVAYKKDLAAIEAAQKAQAEAELQARKLALKEEMQRNHIELFEQLKELEDEHDDLMMTYTSAGLILFIVYLSTRAGVMTYVTNQLNKKSYTELLVMARDLYVQLPDERRSLTRLEKEAFAKYFGTIGNLFAAFDGMSELLDQYLYDKNIDEQWRLPLTHEEENFLQEVCFKSISNLSPVELLNLFALQTSDKNLAWSQRDRLGAGISRSRDNTNTATNRGGRAYTIGGNPPYDKAFVIDGTSVNEPKHQNLPTPHDFRESGIPDLLDRDSVSGFRQFISRLATHIPLRIPNASRVQRNLSPQRPTWPRASGTVPLSADMNKERHSVANVGFPDNPETSKLTSEQGTQLLEILKKIEEHKKSTSPLKGILHPEAVKLLRADLAYWYSEYEKLWQKVQISRKESIDLEDSEKLREEFRDLQKSENLFNNLKGSVADAEKESLLVEILNKRISYRLSCEELGIPTEHIFSAEDLDLNASHLFWHLLNQYSLVSTESLEAQSSWGRAAESPKRRATLIANRHEAEKAKRMKKDGAESPAPVHPLEMIRLSPPPSTPPQVVNIQGTHCGKIIINL